MARCASPLEENVTAFVLQSGTQSGRICAPFSYSVWPEQRSRSYNTASFRHAGTITFWWRRRRRNHLLRKRTPRGRQRLSDPRPAACTVQPRPRFFANFGPARVYGTHAAACSCRAPKTKSTFTVIRSAERAEPPPADYRTRFCSHGMESAPRKRPQTIFASRHVALLGSRFDCMVRACALPFGITHTQRELSGAAKATRPSKYLIFI